MIWCSPVPLRFNLLLLHPPIRLPLLPSTPLAPNLQMPLEPLLHTPLAICGTAWKLSYCHEGPWIVRILALAAQNLNRIRVLFNQNICSNWGFTENSKQTVLNRFTKVFKSFCETSSIHFTYLKRGGREAPGCRRQLLWVMLKKTDFGGLLKPECKEKTPVKHKSMQTQSQRENYNVACIPLYP